MREVAVQALYRAIGYFGSPLPEIPFDENKGVFPNHEGQVLDASGKHIPGIYATGWIKRGPVGLIGHTKSDAMETISHVIEDQATWWSPSEPEEGAIVDLLDQRGVEYTTVEGWAALDDYERKLGEKQERERIKVVERDEMLEVSRDL
jgi:ferredoxin--NADP+ reductase